MPPHSCSFLVVGVTRAPRTRKETTMTSTTATAAEYFAIATAQDVKAELAGGRRNLNLSLAALTMLFNTRKHFFDSGY